MDQSYLVRFYVFCSEFIFLTEICKFLKPETNWTVFQKKLNEFLLFVSYFLRSRLHGCKDAGSSGDESAQTATAIQQTQQAAAADRLRVRTRVFTVHAAFRAIFIHVAHEIHPYNQIKRRRLLILENSIKNTP